MQDLQAARKVGRFVVIEGRKAMSDDGYWTYSEWLKHTVDKIVTLGLSAPAEHREDYLRVQIEAAIRQSLRHGRSGRSDDDPVMS
jgi:hypothetical protein